MASIIEEAHHIASKDVRLLQSRMMLFAQLWFCFLVPHQHRIESWHDEQRRRFAGNQPAEDGPGQRCVGFAAFFQARAVGIMAKNAARAVMVTGRTRSDGRLANRLERD